VQRYGVLLSTNNKNMKIAIIGTGYVGLVTGTCFAEVGHQVTCVDCDAEKVKLLNSGGMPIYEPGLEELVQKNLAAGRLRFSTSNKEAVEQSQVIFIAVNTPPLADGGVDLSFVEGVAREIAAAMTSHRVIVDKSTVPVKTGEKVAETIKRYCKTKVEFDVVSNPEFLREGFAVGDFMHPDRVVVGVSSQRPVQTLKEIYAPFNAPIIVTDINSAELIKHAANSFLALKISYVNALSVICEGLARQRAGGSQWNWDGHPDRPAVPGRLAGLRRKLLPKRFERLHQDFRTIGL
jgi:UDPglucose 6-dehydrogenase